MTRWKARVELLLSVIELLIINQFLTRQMPVSQVLFLSLAVEALQGKCVKTRWCEEGVGHLDPRFQGEGVVPLPIY